MKHKSEKRTMFMSVIMSAPGPLILLFALSAGRSSTQVADLVRRSAELLALILAYITFCLTEKFDDPTKKAQYEHWANLFTGLMMCLGGGIMLVLALVSGQEAQGSVIPSMAIALLGVVANSLFWRKYRALNKADPNAIVAVQARLYRAKALVDICVVIALLGVWLLPGSKISYYLDMVGSSIVALYLISCGIKTIGETRR